MIALLGVAFAYDNGRDEDIEVTHVGYLDLGFFDAAGDGVAYQRDRPAFHEPDVGQTLEIPERFAPCAAWVAGPCVENPDDLPAWVFWGDPWANAVNSQGQSADLGLSRNPIQRFDTLRSGGRPVALVNRLHYGIQVDRGETLGLRARINLDPRQGTLGSPGDWLSLDVAYLVWHPTKKADVTVYVGRIESAFGTEYIQRRASVRYGITPSLMARYTVGRQTGIRVRGTAQRWFDYSASVATGSSVDEGFGHFSDEIDANGAPTVTGRVGAHTSGTARVSGGLSGQLGARDGQPDPWALGWMVGADAQLEAGHLVLRADGMFLHFPPGGGDEDSLVAHGGAIEAWYQVTNHFGPLARLDWRDADLRVQDNLYLSNVLRVTVGCRFDLDYHTAWKAEWLHLHELEGLQLRDDVITTSLVFRY